jgi:hypothetical protein
LKDSEGDMKLLICLFYGVFGMIVFGTMASVIAKAVKNFIIKIVQKIKNLFSFNKKVLTESQLERQEMIRRLKQLKEYEDVFETKSRRVHVLG